MVDIRTVEKKKPRQWKDNEEVLNYYKKHYSGLTRGKLKEIDRGIYESMWDRGLINHVPTFKEKEAGKEKTERSKEDENTGKSKEDIFYEAAERLMYGETIKEKEAREKRGEEKKELPTSKYVDQLDKGRCYWAIVRLNSLTDARNMRKDLIDLRNGKKLDERLKDIREIKGNFDNMLKEKYSEVKALNCIKERLKAYEKTIDKLLV